MTMNRNQYPCVEFDLDKLAANLTALVERCHDSLIEVAGVVKAVSSLPEIVRVYEESGVKFIATSRISQMRAIREAGICKKPLMLIRIPMLSELPDVVELCDISLQSDIIVLRALNEEAKKQGKVHEVILMMDLGDLREGFWNEEDALDAALEIEHELKNLRLAGVGVNLSATALFCRPSATCRRSSVWRQTLSTRSEDLSTTSAAARRHPPTWR